MQQRAEVRNLLPIPRKFHALTQRRSHHQQDEQNPQTHGRPKNIKQNLKLMISLLYFSYYFTLHHNKAAANKKKQLRVGWV